MNERISAFLARLGDDPSLRDRFEQNAAEVMAAQGLSAAEQAEVLQRMNEPTSRGRIFAASQEDRSPEEVEGRIHAPEGRIHTPEGRIHSTSEEPEGRIHAPDDDPQGRIHAPDDDPEGRIHAPSEPEAPAKPSEETSEDASGAPPSGRGTE